MDSEVKRRELVKTLQRDRHLHSARVADALLAVPREAFVPGLPLDEVYRPSEAIVVKRVEGLSVSSASAPEVIALMLEQLDARPGDRVLEIGAGTGYNAALLAHLVGPEGSVVTIDIDEDLVQAAREHLSDAGFDQVEVVQTDGALGYPPKQPYDRIMLTVASSDLTPAWYAQLGRPHGRVVMPLALRALQRCVALVPEGAHCLKTDSLRACSFISMRGALGEAAASPVRPELFEDLLRPPLRAWPTGVSLTLDELRQGMHLWLVARDPAVYTVWSGESLPDLFGLSERQPEARGTICLVDAATARLAFLAWADEGAYSGELCVMAPLGADVHAQRLLRLVGEWAEAGRPLDADLAIRACLRESGEAARPGEVELAQRWSQFFLSWRFWN